MQKRKRHPMPLGYGDAISLVYGQRVVHLCYREQWHHARLAVLNQKRKAKN